jgi:hypothetical protein
MSTVKETKEAIELALTFVDIYVGAKQDGKIDMQDFGLLLKLIPVMSAGTDGLAQIPSELADLSAEELAELSTLVVSRLAIKDEHTQLIVEKALKAAHAGYELVKAVKSTQAPSA